MSKEGIAAGIGCLSRLRLRPPARQPIPQTYKEEIAIGNILGHSLCYLTLQVCKS